MHTLPDDVYRNFNSQLSSYVCKKVNHDDACYDIMQELYLKISLQANKISKAKNTEAYITRMAANAVNDFYRRTRDATVVKENFTQVIDEPIEGIDKSLVLADCCLLPMIESLPHIYKQALIMTDINGMRQNEYAGMLGLNISAAKSRIQRAREKLKEAILNCCNYKFDKYGNIISCCNDEALPGCCN